MKLNYFILTLALALFIIGGISYNNYAKALDKWIAEHKKIEERIANYVPYTPVKPRGEQLTTIREPEMIRTGIIIKVKPKTCFHTINGDCLK